MNPWEQNVANHEAMMRAEMARNRDGSRTGAVKHIINQLNQARRDAASYAEQQNSGGSGGGGGNTPAPPTAAEIAAERARLEEQARVNQRLKEAKVFFTTYGLDKLWSGVEKYIRQGYNDMATVAGALSRDKAYQEAYFERFPAVQQIRELNKQRQKDGMPIMAEPSPSTYVELEKGYRRAVRGLPPGLFDTVDSITEYIVNDVAPTEVQERALIAKNYINYDANDSIKTELRRLYGMTNEEMAAYVLDPDRTLGYVESLYEKRMATATVAGAANTAGISVSDAMAAQVGGNDVYGRSYGNSLAQFNAVADVEDAYDKLGQLSGVNTTTDELVSEQFGLEGAADVKKKKKKLASAERARFGGKSGVGRNSLSSGRKAQ